MIKVSPYVHDENGPVMGYTFYCPGCKSHHAFYSSWYFNGDLEKPTVSPSILVHWVRTKNDESGKVIPNSGEAMTCHSFITNGNIRYLNDCTHELAGKSIELPEL